MQQLSYVKAVAVTSLPSATGMAGVTVRLTTDDHLYSCDGTAWYRVTGNPKITVSASAPGSPATNDIWIDIS